MCQVSGVVWGLGLRYQPSRSLYGTFERFDQALKQQVLIPDTLASVPCVCQRLLHRTDISARRCSAGARRAMAECPLSRVEVCLLALPRPQRLILQSTSERVRQLPRSRQRKLIDRVEVACRGDRIQPARKKDNARHGGRGVTVQAAKCCGRDVARRYSRRAARPGYNHVRLEQHAFESDLVL